jgi:hypothetical protein
MSKVFKKGDKLVMVNPEGCYTGANQTHKKGDIFFAKGDAYDSIIYVQKDDGTDCGGVFVNRFELAKDYIDFTKPLETSTGIPVEFIAICKREKAYPVMAYIGTQDSMYHFTMEGKFFNNGTPHLHDIRNVKPLEAYAYVNLYRTVDNTSAFRAYESRAEADAAHEKYKGADIRVGVTKVLVKEGDNAQ